MYTGQIVYHGPRQEVLPFFASCGFRPPVRKATPDFLQEVTSQKDQEVSAIAQRSVLLECVLSDAAQPTSPAATNIPLPLA